MLARERALALWISEADPLGPPAFLRLDEGQTSRLRMDVHALDARQVGEPAARREVEKVTVEEPDVVARRHDERGRLRDRTKVVAAGVGQREGALLNEGRRHRLEIVERVGAKLDLAQRPEEFGLRVPHDAVRAVKLLRGQ